MSGDYLWDGTGEPDPEIERLEGLLGELRHDRPAPAFPALPEAPTRRPFGGPFSTLAAAAALLLALGTLWQTPSRRGAWEVARLEGEPRVSGDRLGARGRLRVGQWLETDERSRAQIRVGKIGQVNVEPRTRISLVDAGVAQHRLRLARGTLHARIGAPPRQFVVDTPSAAAVDIGCRYTLHVDDDGVGFVSVEHGWVAFETRGRESFVPAHARCVTRPGVGPGTPYYEAASQRFAEALAQFDFDARDAAARSSALEVVLVEARREDALTLWHMLSRTSGADRERVYERLGALVAPPANVTREGIMAGDGAMLDLWWDALDLRKMSFWREWKGSWPLRPQ